MGPVMWAKDELEVSENLYVANIGPGVGVSYADIAEVVGSFGDIKAVYPADDSGVRVVVCVAHHSFAQATIEALDAHPCLDLGGRSLHICYSLLNQHQHERHQHNNTLPVSLMTSELNIPGLYLFHDFVTLQQEPVT